MTCSRTTFTFHWFHTPRCNVFLRVVINSIYYDSFNTCRYHHHPPTTTTTTTTTTTRTTLNPQRCCFSSRHGKIIPTLKQFLHWKEVTTLYRSFLRLTRADSLIRHEIQLNFRKNINLNDPIEITRALQEGKKQYKVLNLSYGVNRLVDYDNRGMIIKEEQDDVVGRIGVEWPWEKKSRK